MTNEPGYYKRLLESLLEATPDWVRDITPTDNGPVANFYHLDYPLRLADNTQLKVNRIQLDVNTGLIKVYFSLDSSGVFARDKTLEGLDQALMPLFEQVFAPYELDNVHRTRLGDFIKHDAHEVFVNYGCYFLSGQVESAWFEYLDNMDYDTKLQAVTSDPDYIKYIDEPDEPMQLAAITKDPYSIQWIANPTDSAQLTAIKNHTDTLLRIKNPTVLSQPGIKLLIMKYLIGRLKINARFHSADIVDYLRKHGVQWPELAVIEQSLNAPKLG
jgi:hypothetical protein